MSSRDCTPGTPIKWRSSANDAPAVHATKAATSRLLLESVPEAKSLVASAGDDDFAVWTHGKIEDAVGVASQGDNLLHARILPDNDLVLAVTVG